MAADDAAVYTAAGTHDVTAIVWSLKGDGTDDDAELFNINSATGAVTFKAATTPDYETKSSYAFTVVATTTGVVGFADGGTGGEHCRDGCQ